VFVCLSVCASRSVDTTLVDIRQSTHAKVHVYKHTHLKDELERNPISHVTHHGHAHTHTPCIHAPRAFALHHIVQVLVARNREDYRSVAAVLARRPGLRARMRCSQEA
jgi:hypothetical protein